MDNVNDLEIHFSKIRALISGVEKTCAAKLRHAAEDATKNEYLQRLSRAELDAQDYGHELSLKSVQALELYKENEKLRLENDELRVRLTAERKLSLPPEIKRKRFKVFG